MHARRSQPLVPDLPLYPRIRAALPSSTPATAATHRSQQTSMARSLQDARMATSTSDLLGSASTVRRVSTRRQTHAVHSRRSHRSASWRSGSVLGLGAQLAGAVPTASRREDSARRWRVREREARTNDARTARSCNDANQRIALGRSGGGGGGPVGGL